MPGYDRWFDGMYTKQWGAKNGTEVIVDHMAATEKVLSGVLDRANNVGYPGYATAATGEVFNAFIIPTMFGRVARDEITAEAAAAAAQKDVERMFSKWRAT